MERVIKFRAIDDTGAMREVKEVHWLPKNGGISYIEFIPKGGGEPRGSRKDTLMQFTGLTDKNGKEIYEGDIVKGRAGPILEVRHGSYLDQDSNVRHYGWYTQDCEGWDYNEPYEVIGNVHENPDLLKDHQ